MKMAVKDGMIYIIEFTDYEFAAMRSWNSLRYVKGKCMMQGPVSLELLDRLAGLTTLPPRTAAVRDQLRRTQDAVDRLRTAKHVPDLVDFPVKGSLYEHQKRAAEMALVEFGLIDPGQVLDKEEKDDRDHTGSKEDHP